MTPSTNVIECTVNLDSKKVLFSCVVDGNESVHAWRIKIYTLDKNSLVYDTGKITSCVNLPFLPINEKNQNTVFEVNLKDFKSTGNVDGTSFVNSPKPYYWTMEFWNKTDTEATVKSCEEVFYANSVPNVTVDYKSPNGDYNRLPVDGSGILSSNDFYFRAEYTQIENVPLKRYGWRIIDTNSGEVLLDTITKKQVYGTSDNIVCHYDGFLNNNSYSVQLYIETQNNFSMMINPISFLVSYETTFLKNDFVTEILRYESGIRNSWGEAKIIEGRIEGIYNPDELYVPNYPIADGSTSTIDITKDFCVVYDYGATSNLDISEKSYIVLSTQLSENTDMEIFTAEGIDSKGNALLRKLSYTSGQFVYTVSDAEGYKILYHTPNKGYEPGLYTWYIIIMSPYLGDDTKLTIYESKAENGLAPSDTRYPREILYPSFGTWDRLKV